MAARECSNRWLPANGGLWTVLVLSVVALMGVACRSTDAAPRAQETPTPAPHITIGLLLSSLSDPLYVSLQSGAVESANRLDAELVVRQAGNDAGRQLQQIEELLALEVHALVLNPVDSAAIGAGVQQANDAGVTVITVERRVRGATVSAHVAPDNIAGGEMAATYLVERLQEQGRVAELVGIPGTSAAQNRGSGFNRVLGAYAGMEIVARSVANFDRQQARRAFADLLEEHGDLDAVFAHNDAMILGAIEAAEEAGRAQEIVFVGFDAMDEAIRAIEDGRLEATVAQQPAEMGRIAVEIAVEQLRSGDVSEELTVDLALVTR